MIKQNLILSRDNFNALSFYPVSIENVTLTAYQSKYNLVIASITCVCR